MSLPRPLALLGEGLAPLLPSLHILCPQGGLALSPVVLRAGASPSTLHALSHLGFAGALLDSGLETRMFGALERLSPAARICGAVDVLSTLGGEYQGGYLLEEALRRTLEGRGFRLAGARLLVLGAGPMAVAAAQLARSGASRLVVASETLSQAEAVARTLPMGGEAGQRLARYVLTLGDERLEGLLERVDLVVQAGATLPPRLWQPYHTLLDLNPAHAGLDAVPHADSASWLARVGGQSLPLHEVTAERLRLQLEAVSGLRLPLETVRAAMGPG